jgi:hypothetical protein
LKDVQDVVSKTTLPTESLHDQQLALEEESQRTGIHAYRKAEARRREKGLEAITGPVAHLVRV